jgi:hypothetical protein
MTLTKLLCGGALLLYGLQTVPAAEASVLIGDNYTRTGTSESLSAPFTSVATATANTYSGFVEVIVSGTGASLFSQINDAFYGVPGGSPYDSQYYQLNVGWTSAPLTGAVGEPRNINNFIVFIEGTGAVTPTATPAYATANDHRYHFVVDTGLVSAEHLQFGVSDGNFGDNFGAYLVDVFQLASGVAIAEPAALGLFGLGLLGLGLAAGRRKAA